MIMSTDPADPHSLLPTRPSLLRRIGDPQDSASWTEFYRLYKNLVFGFACRSGLSRADAEEVTQDVFNRVSQTIHDFESNPERGTFRGWLRNLTRWRVMDKLRERQRRERGQAPRESREEDDRTDTIERIADSAAEAQASELWESEWEHRVLDAAMTHLRDRVDPKHFQIFELQATHGKSATEIARELELNRATVYVIHYRLRKLLIAEIGRLKAELE